MSVVISCPHCHTDLRLGKAANPDSKIRCPRCRHGFAFRQSAQPGSETEPGGVSRWLILGGSAAVLVLVVTIGLVVAWPWGGQPEPQPAPAQPVMALTPAQPAPVKTELAPASPDPVPKKTEPEKKPEPEKKSETPAPTPEPNREKRRQEYTRLMIQGARASDTGKLADAVVAYQQSLALFPGDADAQQGLQQVQARLDTQIKARQQEEEKKRENLAVLVKQGEAALKDGQTAAAVELFKLALQQDPKEAAAAKGLATAQAALAQDQQQKQKQADFVRHLAAGKTALQAGRFADALKDLIAAQVLQPDNPEARKLAQLAEKKLGGDQQQAEKQKNLDQLLAQAANAASAGRFADAEQLYGQALKLNPTNKMAQQGLQDAQRQLQTARRDFTTAVERAQVAAQAGRYLDAAAAYREALRLDPDNKTVQAALREVETNQTRLGDYNDAMRRALTALSLKRHADAVQAYTQALNSLPGDPQATLGLRDAQALLQRDAQRQQEFEQKVRLGQTALQQQNYASAAQLLTEAQKLAPLQARVTMVRQQARFATAMASGIEAMNGKNYQEAAQQFQNAVNEFPQDFQARQALIRARSLTGVGITPPFNPKKKN